MHKSHYANYIEERENKDIIEDEKGFATYSYVDNGIYIEDIYVAPEFRNQKVASSYGAIIEDIARKSGLSYVYGSVATDVNGVTESLKRMIGYGYSVYKCETNMIYFIKEIK